MVFYNIERHVQHRNDQDLCAIDYRTMLRARPQRKETQGTILLCRIELLYFFEVSGASLNSRCLTARSLTVPPESFGRLCIPSYTNLHTFS